MSLKDNCYQVKFFNFKVWYHVIVIFQISIIPCGYYC